MATHAASDAKRTPEPRGAPAAWAVSGQFQLRYVIRLGLVVLCGAAATVGVLYLFLARELGGYAENMTIISAVRSGVLTASLVSALLQIVFTCVLMMGLALFASHKIAGPTVRLTGELARVAEGRLPGPVRFRQGDQVGTLESRYNEVSRLLGERHARARQALDAVRAAGERLRAAHEKPEARRAAAADLRVRAAELADLLAAAASPEVNG